MKNAANKITLLRIILVPFFMLFMYLKWTYIALFVYIIACVSDFFDGMVARRCDQVSNFGRFMDPLADKILTLSAMCLFVEYGLMPAWVVAIVLLREFAVSGLRLIAVERGVIISAAFSGKVKTVTSMIALGILIAINEPWLPFAAIWPYVCSAAILLTTLWSGIEYFVKNYAVLKARTDNK